VLRLFDFFPFGADPSPRLAEWNTVFTARVAGLPVLFTKAPAPNGEVRAVLQGTPFKVFDDVNEFFVADRALQFVDADDEQVEEMGQAPDYVSRAFALLEKHSHMVAVLSPEFEFFLCRFAFPHTKQQGTQQGYSRLLTTSSAGWTIQHFNGAANGK
jgi:hypothetical protein